MIVQRRGSLARTFGWSAAISVLGAFGCSLAGLGLRDKDQTGRLDEGGRLVAPEQYQLDVVVLSRPQGDPTLNSTLWAVADEQVFEADLRRALQANGLRVGRITGALPPEVEALLNAEPPDRPEPLTIVQPTGTASLIDPNHGPARAELTLLRSHPDGKVGGKTYGDAKGFLRVNGQQDPAGGIALRAVPELHYGPITQTFGAVPTAGIPAPLEFMSQSGQKQETFRDLAAVLNLARGETLVIGCHPEKLGSLGDLLFQRLDGPSDRVIQSVVLIQSLPVGGDASPPPGLTPIDPDDPALGLVGPTAR